MLLDQPTSIEPRPTGNLNCAMRDLDQGADQVKGLVESGNLIAFNIAVKETSRLELRILTRSIEYYLQTKGNGLLVLEWPEIFRLLVPHQNMFVRGHEIARGLNCDRGHVENLILSGLLAVSKKSRHGPDGSPFIPRYSYEQFLIGRLQ